jgi:hypothetical protein
VVGAPPQPWVGSDGVVCLSKGGVGEAEQEEEVSWRMIGEEADDHRAGRRS